MAECSARALHLLFSPRPWELEMAAEDQEFFSCHRGATDPAFGSSTPKDQPVLMVLGASLLPK